jgi:transcriptional regulator with XRE-family HTH domain
MSTSSFGALLRGRRLSLGWTQSKLANAIGVQPNYIVYLEKGSRRPSDKTVSRLADALELDRSELYLAANPQIRDFLRFDEDRVVARDNLSVGLTALRDDTETRTRLEITDAEIAMCAGVHVNGHATDAEQYATFIQMARYIFK